MRQSYQNATTDEWVLGLRHRMNELEKRIGRGSTYSTSEINEFLDYDMRGYELLFRGRRYGKPPIAKRCEKAIEFLKGIPPRERMNVAKRVEPLLQELSGWFQ